MAPLKLSMVTKSGKNGKMSSIFNRPPAQPTTAQHSTAQHGTFACMNHVVYSMSAARDDHQQDQYHKVSMVETSGKKGRMSSIFNKPPAGSPTPTAKHGTVTHMADA
jgi:hypothetical protein